MVRIHRGSRIVWKKKKSLKTPGNPKVPHPYFKDWASRICRLAQCSFSQFGFRHAPQMSLDFEVTSRKRSMLMSESLSYILRSCNSQCRPPSSSIMSYVISHNIMPCHTLHHIASRNIKWCQILPHRITSHNIASHRIASHHITSHHVTSRQITSHHITSHHSRQATDTPTDLLLLQSLEKSICSRHGPTAGGRDKCGGLTDMTFARRGKSAPEVCVWECCLSWLRILVLLLPRLANATAVPHPMKNYETPRRWCHNVPEHVSNHGFFDRLSYGHLTIIPFHYNFKMLDYNVKAIVNWNVVKWPYATSVVVLRGWRGFMS